MFIHVGALKRREAEACVWDPRALCGIKVMFLQVFSCNLNKGRGRRFKGRVMKELRVQLTRDELYTDFISFSYEVTT